MPRQARWAVRLRHRSIWKGGKRASGRLYATLKRQRRRRDVSGIKRRSTESAVQGDDGRPPSNGRDAVSQNSRGHMDSRLDKHGRLFGGTGLVDKRVRGSKAVRAKGLRAGRRCVSVGSMYKAESWAEQRRRQAKEGKTAEHKMKEEEDWVGQRERKGVSVGENLEPRRPAEWALAVRVRCPGTGTAASRASKGRRCSARLQPTGGVAGAPCSQYNAVPLQGHTRATPRPLQGHSRATPVHTWASRSTPLPCAPPLPCTPASAPPPSQAARRSACRGPARPKPAFRPLSSRLACPGARLPMEALGFFFLHATGPATARYTRLLFARFLILAPPHHPHHSGTAVWGWTRRVPATSSLYPPAIPSVTPSQRCLGEQRLSAMPVVP
ncbi:hypothetical protein CDD81_3720 [Ophiocordyceps australis]|uniref:Uncharacterized protein n=1 Tax=Ophiocordyceps australis TaxID=1399860 RepID=A0A2C5XVY6_9HYPO|nr:hypothetical protein CDD81_3720 [Ophiocordyceps australis]